MSFLCGSRTIPEMEQEARETEFEFLAGVQDVHRYKASSGLCGSRVLEAHVGKYCRGKR